MQRLGRATLFNKSQLTPAHHLPTPTNLRTHTCVIEPWRNLSFSVGNCQDFITIGTNVRKAIIPLP